MSLCIPPARVAFIKLAWLLCALSCACSGPVGGPSPGEQGDAGPGVVDGPAPFVTTPPARPADLAGCDDLSSARASEARGWPGAVVVVNLACALEPGYVVTLGGREVEAYDVSARGFAWSVPDMPAGEYTLELTSQGAPVHSIAFEVLPPLATPRDPSALFEGAFSSRRARLEALPASANRDWMLAELDRAQARLGAFSEQQRLELARWLLANERAEPMDFCLPSEDPERWWTCYGTRVTRYMLAALIAGGMGHIGLSTPTPVGAVFGVLGWATCIHALLELQEAFLEASVPFQLDALDIDLVGAFSIESGSAVTLGVTGDYVSLWGASVGEDASAVAEFLERVVSVEDLVGMINRVLPERVTLFSEGKAPRTSRGVVTPGYLSLTVRRRAGADVTISGLTVSATLPPFRPQATVELELTYGFDGVRRLTRPVNVVVSPGDPCASCEEGQTCQPGLGCVTVTCGGDGEPCCSDEVCSGSLECAEDGSCRPCGEEGQACCVDGPECDGDFRCHEEVCEAPCGRDGEECCPQDRCLDGGQACIAGTCQPRPVWCGGRGEACCAQGEACLPGLSCDGGACAPTPCDGNGDGMFEATCNEYNPVCGNSYGQDRCAELGHTPCDANGDDYGRICHANTPVCHGFATGETCGAPGSFACDYDGDGVGIVCVAGTTCVWSTGYSPPREFCMPPYTNSTPCDGNGDGSADASCNFYTPVCTELSGGDACIASSSIPCDGNGDGSFDEVCSPDSRCVNNNGHDNCAANTSTVCDMDMDGVAERVCPYYRPRCARNAQGVVSCY